jgi:DNA recombination protein RmuC
VRAILKDARMREQAHVIQTEIGKMMEDVVRLDKRVGQLSTHFAQTQKDVEEIRTSTTKIVRRGAVIETIQLEAPARSDEPPLAGLLPDDDTAES